MDPTQQKALNALESYVLLSKSATSPRAAVDLITQAISAPNTYVFAELLQTPNIQALRSASPEHACYLTLLEIFAWGTWTDYQGFPLTPPSSFLSPPFQSNQIVSETSNLPPLTDAQSQKLRQLTLLTLATSPSTLSYTYLLAALSLPSIRALEDLIISNIYAGLLSAKLDTLAKRMDVSSVAPLRDLRPDSVPQMVAVLEDWDSRCVSVLAEIEEQVIEVRRKAQEVRRRELENEKAVEKAMETESEKGKGKSAGKRGAREVVDRDGAGGEGGDEMDVDEAGGRGTKRGSKRGGKIAGIAKKWTSQ